MAISSLDTLDIARRLKGAGFNDAQAETVTEIFRDVRETDLANLSTKTDIERLEAATDFDIGFPTSFIEQISQWAFGDVSLRVDGREAR